MKQSNRRDFLKKLAMTTGAVVLMPAVSACKSAPAPAPEDPKTDAPTTDAPESQPATSAATTPATPPLVKPEGWDAIAYNKERGNAGAIPESYLGKVNGADGDTKHLGKHLPYIPTLDEGAVPAGFIALMWGDPAKGHAKHPNAVRSEANNNEGHWYNWIRVRKAVEGDAEELESSYAEWPGVDADASKYAVFGGGDITAESGKNTIYMTALPADVKPGDTIRIHAHCLTHGEYVDFITV